MHLIFGIKGKKKKNYNKKTQIICNTKNPIWNQELTIISNDKNSDILEVDMLQEDIMNPYMMMDTIV